MAVLWCLAQRILSMTDAEYIQAFRADDQALITRFYNEHRAVFMRDIAKYYHILNADLMAEIFQETIIRLWRNIASAKLTEQTLTTSLAGYLFSIGKYVAQEKFREEHKELSVDDEAVQLKSEGPLWEEESAQEKAVRKAVYTMGEPCASLLLLFYWDKLSWETIAAQLHYKDAESAKSQKYKCMKKLKSYFLQSEVI